VLSADADGGSAQDSPDQKKPDENLGITALVSQQPAIQHRLAQVCWSHNNQQFSTGWHNCTGLATTSNSAQAGTSVLVSQQPAQAGTTVLVSQQPAIQHRLAQVCW